MIATAYYDGYWAAMDGATSTSNPYDPEVETPRWMSWAEGWEDSNRLTYVSDR